MLLSPRGRGQGEGAVAAGRGIDLVVDPRVRALRQSQTEAERLLWRQLRGKRVGDLRFRRQYPLGNFIVDFVCLAARLVIEVDGPSHDLTVDADERRTRWLESQGFRVLRFTNDQVRYRLPDVVDAIAAALPGEEVIAN
ncbi:endonuclease domain-containing protein [Inquilinus sp. OTU3971]|uniref:endonuclease domain-containing protein n=1 Tax=Inquilinus sp. OTU3971 TaxID=3043855 RepID=UPI00313F06C3